MKIKEVEQSLALGIAQTFMPDVPVMQGGSRRSVRGIHPESPPNSHDAGTGESSSHGSGATAQLLNPRLRPSSDHVCTWRNHYLELKPQVEQLTSELSLRKKASTLPGRVDVGVGDALAQHTCEEYGIEGLTIVMHMKGRSDIIINTDLTRESSTCGQE
ncbi:hypothetical protein S7711_07954 [Stachybotrys chartarum IBT 7711]|uniref:Uncharacterized protein n=1 Tax=Stachybotrys chartarum (strain CBS 109288 / IBT 7711) TaxID=1280523 RepID=A0A084AKU5_STACB|nr:hypothetical protein S7711_07954 [Stachybotrys chartarum IBT 7711]KFA55793.1 hypothetical protein S40293_01893 [Stachybotrys chartarum IBT 40293]KFA79546.1 hypothetical protein S40288_01053 [Stachybotrys chartarum IBT 40288]